MGTGYFRKASLLLPLRLGAAAALLVLVTLFLPAQARAQSDSETANAQAALLRPITIIRLADMDFGEIIRPSAPGTVVLTPAAAASCTPTGGLVRAGQCRAASFTGEMTFLFLLRITKPVGGQIDLVGPGGATMRLNDFTFGGTTGLLDLGSTETEQRYLVVSPDGTLTFHVGGTLEVSANQASGPYTGAFALQFNYD